MYYKKIFFFNQLRNGKDTKENSEPFKIQMKIGIKIQFKREIKENVMQYKARDILMS